MQITATLLQPVVQGVKHSAGQIVDPDLHPACFRQRENIVYHEDLVVDSVPVRGKGIWSRLEGIDQTPFEDGGAEDRDAGQIRVIPFPQVSGISRSDVLEGSRLRGQGCPPLEFRAED